MEIRKVDGRTVFDLTIDDLSQITPTLKALEIVTGKILIPDKRSIGITTAFDA